ncbi:MAG: hypothetical protein K2J36_09170 [Ruminococcus sp.]|nr:hypothetical protein [Ruminococcus sp.]MDE6798165.1 hypothetical protein [Ruminococcus sp.]
MSKYTFRNSTEEEREENFAGYGKWIYGAVSSEEIYALFFGKVRSRFGVNDSISTDWEMMYSYDITAEDENGNKFFFDVYHGAGGPSIGTPFEELTPEYESAVKALIEYIESAEPVDYVWEGVYEDIPVNVTYTVKDGKARVDSEFPEGMYDDEDIENFM